MIYEVEFATGLIDIVREEVRQVIGKKGHIIGSYRDDSLQFTYKDDKVALLDLKTVIAVYHVVQFDIPRPKALLGHEHFHKLLGVIQPLLDVEQYQSLYLSAAGSESSVMMRIKTELSDYLKLSIAEDEGDLLLRMRRTPKTVQGWDVLVRLTPRPLATRDWRVCNYEGALNASVASALITLTNPTPDDRFLNIGCGSGTIMIERQQQAPAKLIMGCDISEDALYCSRLNIKEANINTIQLLDSDAIQLPLADASIDKLVADLPFGYLSGSHDENEWLYPAILSESARVAQRGATFVIITHEVRLIESILDSTIEWRLMAEPLKITLSGLHPRIYLLERQ
ncbi:MAG: methyltransferase domain-containing protein [Phototrophicaceae bacterium]